MPALRLFLSLSSASQQSSPTLSFCQRLHDCKTVVVANVSSAVTLAVFCCHETCRPAVLNPQIGTNSHLATGQTGQDGRGLLLCGAAVIVLLYYGLKLFKDER
jgi:hypothetical protein